MLDNILDSSTNEPRTSGYKYNIHAGNIEGILLNFMTVGWPVIAELESALIETYHK